MQRALDSFAVAGVAVAVVKDGKIVHEKGYGLRTIEESTPVDAHTNFGIASNSKAFTTTALALLVEEGKLKWTDHVVDHIPEFRMYNEYVTRHFNIQDLLTHRSRLGLGAGAGAVDVGNYTGEYEDPWFGKVDITERDGGLYFRSQRSPKVAGPMSYYGANTFVAKWESESLVDADAFVMFSLDETGKAQRIRMKGISPLIDFSFDFQDLDLQRKE